jgi:hypothetical protein
MSELEAAGWFVDEQRIRAATDWPSARKLEAVLANLDLCQVRDDLSMPIFDPDDEEVLRRNALCVWAK